MANVIYSQFILQDLTKAQSTLLVQFGEFADIITIFLQTSPMIFITKSSNYVTIREISSDHIDLSSRLLSAQFSLNNYQKFTKTKGDETKVQSPNF